MDKIEFLDRDKVNKLIEEIRLYGNIRPEDIPEYRLYISQIEEFFDKKLGGGGGDEEDRKTISKTMIQNYIKDGLLMPPEGKYYNRTHVILLALIYNLKSVLPIKDIKKLFYPILARMKDEGQVDNLEYVYNNYLELKETALNEFTESLVNDIEVIKKYLDNQEIKGDNKDKIYLILLVLLLITQADARKKFAERIIEEYFIPDEGNDNGS